MTVGERRHASVKLVRIMFGGTFHPTEAVPSSVGIVILSSAISIGLPVFGRGLLMATQDVVSLSAKLDCTPHFS